MTKKEKIIVFIVFIIVAVPIVINEINIRPKLNLINDVKKILKNLDSYELNEDGVAEEVIINNGYTLDDKEYNVKGTGVIFVDEDNSVFLNRNGMCAMKLPYSDEVMIQYESCPVYRMFNGIKTPLQTSKSGLYELEDKYVYKGNDLSNYVLFDDMYFQILGFENGNIKLIKTIYDEINYSSIDDLYAKLSENYADLINNSLVINNDWNIEEIDSNKIIINKSITSKVGILSITDYLNSLLSSYKINDNVINISDESYLSKEMILSNKKYYLDKSGQITSDITNKIYPVIVLSSKAIVSSGSGTKVDPYIIKEAE